ncbi:MAG: ParB family chromosome partitioning protein [Candidatus Promineifilaceae bacterium]|jgi:ParB family chromosome partitioning protein
MAKRKGLGRGLGALIPTEAPADTQPTDATPTTNKNGLRSVLVSSIIPNPKQPRSTFVEEKLQELADSIKEHGLIQPLIVSEYKQGHYHLIAGERRWRASQRAGLEEVLVVVREASPQEMLELAIIENVQRDDLNALEEAMAYHQLMQEFNLTQIEVSKKMGKARSTVANLLRLIELPALVQQAVVDGKISGRHARELLRLESNDDITYVLASIINSDLNVAKTINLIDTILAGKKTTPKEKPQLAPELNDVQQQFRQHLGMKVDIAGSNKKGKIVIHYDSGEDLNTIYEHFISE